MRSQLYASPSIPPSLHTCTHTRSHLHTTEGYKCTVDENLCITTGCYLLCPEWHDREMSEASKGRMSDRIPCPTKLDRKH